MILNAFKSAIFSLRLIEITGNLQSFRKSLRQTLVFMENSTVLERLNFSFSEDFPLEPRKVSF